MIPYKYHTDSFDEIAVKIEEPDESLEELLANYETAKQQFREFKQRLREAEAPYRRTRINILGREETYVDYDAWEEEDPDSCYKYGFADFNGFNALDMMEDMIDAKIYYINQREEQDL